MRGVYLYSFITMLVSLLLLINIRTTSSFQIQTHSNIKYKITHQPSIYSQYQSISNIKLFVSKHSYNESSQSKSWRADKFKYINQIPNALTVLRVILILPFAIAYITQKNSLACGLFIFASFTDWLDGYLARKLRISSSFGSFLDPVADKLIVSTALVLLVMTIPVWWFSVTVAIIICREVFVSALREWMAQRGLSATVKVGNLGKVKTAMQMVSAVLLIDSGPSVVSTASVKVLTTATAASTATSVVKGVQATAKLATATVSAVETTCRCSLSRILHIPRPVLFALGLGAFFISAVLTVISGMEYLRAAWPLLSDKTSSNKSDVISSGSGSGSGSYGDPTSTVVNDVDPNKTPYDIP